MSNDVDPDQMPYLVLSDLGIHSLLMPVCPNTEGYYGSLYTCRCLHGEGLDIEEPISEKRGAVRWCEGVVYLTSPGHPTDIGLQLGKACYPCSR